MISSHNVQEKTNGFESRQEILIRGNISKSQQQSKVSTEKSIPGVYIHTAVYRIEFNLAR